MRALDNIADDDYDEDDYDYEEPYALDWIQIWSRPNSRLSNSEFGNFPLEPPNQFISMMANIFIVTVFGLLLLIFVC